MERKIGEVFECDGKCYKVVESDLGCNRCVFKSDNECGKIEIFGYCEDILRKDETDVVFVEVDDKNKGEC